MINLEEIELCILRVLQQESNITNVELAQRVFLSASPCLGRVNSLRSSGLIRGYVALLHPTVLGLHLNVVISISLKQQSSKALEDFEERVCFRPEVVECFLMTGDAKYLLRVLVHDMRALERFILEQLSPIPQMEKIRSSFALQQVRYTSALPLNCGEKAVALRSRT